MKKLMPVIFAAASVAGLLGEPKNETFEIRRDEPGNPPRALSAKKGSAQIKGGHSQEVRAFAFNDRLVANSSVKPLIVRSSKIDDKTNSQLQEDLTVMARILEKASSDFKNERDEAAGIPIVMHGGRSVRAMYLEGYGAVFTLNVNIPLKPDPKPEDLEKKQDDSDDEEWEEAKNEVLGKKRPGKDKGRKAAARKPYDQDQVDQLRGSLIDALKNATNIRNLTDSDSITVVVRSGDGPTAERFNVEFHGVGEPMIWDSANEDRAGEATLVLKVKKSDLGQAGKKANPENLKNSVNVVVY